MENKTYYVYFGPESIEVFYHGYRNMYYKGSVTKEQAIRELYVVHNANLIDLITGELIIPDAALIAEAASYESAPTGVPVA